MSVDKLVDSTQLDADLTSVANAIRTKGGTSAALAFPADFVSAIAAIPSGGGGITWDDFVDYSKPSGAYVFTGTKIPPFCFFRRTGLTSFVGDSVTELQAFAGNRFTFNGCSSLETISLANLSGELPAQVFSNCTSLVSVNLPKITHTGTNYIFNGCAALVGVVFPSFNGRISSQYFVDSACVAFRYLDIKATSTTYGIMQNAFNGAANFDTLIIRGTVVCPLANISAFNNTPFASGNTGGTIYVPSSLKSQYESASNWSTIIGYTNNQIKAIEGTTYETHYADGTTIPT